MDYRVSRLMKKQSISAEEARKIIDEVDKGRENYVKKYTGSSRYDTRNYQLVINVDGHSEDEIVEMILMYLGTSGNKIIF
jgi:cytidylate kinase